jgi:hypothetical protein
MIDFSRAGRLKKIHLRIESEFLSGILGAGNLC